MSRESQNPSCVFLDTTVAVGWVFGEKQERSAHRQALYDKRRCTSTYVRNQYLAGVVRAAALFRELLDDDQTESLVHALERARKFRGRLERQIHPRTFDKILQLTRVLCDSYDDRRKVVEWFDSFIDHWEEYFLTPLTEISLLDETACCRAQLQEGGNGGSDGARRVVIVCNVASPRNCAIETFWEAHNTDVSTLAAMNIDGLTTRNVDVKEMKRAKGTAEMVCTGQKSGHGRICWADLSDAVIVVESLDVEAVASSNVRHFEPLCEVLSQAFVPIVW